MKTKSKVRAKAANPAAVQLEMATALVVVISKLCTDPKSHILAEARRVSSKLHLSLHHGEHHMVAMLN